MKSLSKDLWHRVRRQRQARVVADHQLGVTVAHDIGHGFGRQFPVHRHGDQARLHGAEEGEQELGAIGRQDRDPVATLKPALQQATCDRAGKTHYVAVGVTPLGAVTALVDQRQRVRRHGTRQRIALVVVFETAHAYSMNSSTALIACLAGTITRSAFLTTPSILPACSAAPALASEMVRSVRPAM